jgi:hypothetical protein
VHQEFDRLFAWLGERLQGLPDLLERRAGLTRRASTPSSVDALEEVIVEWQAELDRRLENERELFAEDGAEQEVTRRVE